MSRPSGLELREATLVGRIASRPGAEEWRVELAPGEEALAVAYPALVGSLHEGDRVLLNTTAVTLGLGTGGAHFVVARLAPSPPCPWQRSGPAATHLRWVPGRFRIAGHILKLRYTPLQHAVCSVEAQESPHREQMAACAELGGMPVVAAELHSQMAAAAIAARALGPPGLRIAYVMSDTAALPLGWSRLAARLRQEGVLASAITAGQAFGGDLEAINVHTALLAARAVARADLAIVAQGPGNAGTGTPYGFGGLAQGEHLNAAATLGGLPIAALRVSFADPRPRHQGVSHHSLTVLGRITLGRCRVPLPPLPDAHLATLRAQLDAAGILARHEIETVAMDPDAILAALASYTGDLTTMGRSVTEDPEFFLAAAAAGIAGVCAQRPSGPS